MCEQRPSYQGANGVRKYCVLTVVAAFLYINSFRKYLLRSHAMTGSWETAVNKTDEVLLLRSFILVGEDRKQINCVVETVAMGKIKAG